MQRKTGLKGLIALAVGVGVLALVALMPSFGGGSSEAATAGFSLNRSATVSEFIIPASFVTSSDAQYAAGCPAALSVASGSNDAFPASGKLVIGPPATAGSEVLTYTSKTATSFVISDCSKDIKHTSGSLISLATTTTAKLSADAGADAIHCLSTSTLTATQMATAAAPLKINCNAGGAAGFTGTGALTLSHEATQLDNASEYMKYDQGNTNGSCATLVAADQVCIIARGQQPGNTLRNHKANGADQPCIADAGIAGYTCVNGSTTIVSELQKHTQLTVVSNASFFPTAPLLVYTDGDETNTDEIVTYNNAADKIKTEAVTEFHVVARGGNMAFGQPTAIINHPIGSVVVGAHAQLVCRAGNLQPGVDTNTGTPAIDEPAIQTAGSSVASFPVCQTRVLPGAAPKTLGAGKDLDIPITGQLLIILATLQVPFLTTGGTPAGAFAATTVVDSNGPETGCGPNNPQGIPAVAGCVLRLASPCIVNFSPGTNLFVDVQLTTDVKVTGGVATGSIKVVLDTIPEGPGATHTTCDDPAGTAPISLTQYSAFDGPGRTEGADEANDPCNNGADGPGGSDTKADVLDPDCYGLYNGAVTHDTDGDGCADIEELSRLQNIGGQRDPWNPRDFGDVENANGAPAVVKDKKINLLGDILKVILAFGTGPLEGGANDIPYDVSMDRSLSAFNPPPFQPPDQPPNLNAQGQAWQRGAANGKIQLLGDILPVILEFGSDCTVAP